jgi:hypothetical protein
MNAEALRALQVHIQALLDRSDRFPLTKAERVELAEMITALDDEIA